MSYSPVFEEIVKKFKKICPSDVKVVPRQKHKNYFVPRQFFIHLPKATLSLICREDRDFYMETALFDMKKKKVYFDENLDMKIIGEKCMTNRIYWMKSPESKLRLIFPKILENKNDHCMLLVLNL